MRTHFFVTGGTGMMGSDLLPRLLRAYPESLLTLLLRGKSPSDAGERARRIALTVGGECGIPDAVSRVRGVLGDVTQERLGVSPGEIERLTGTVTHIIHGAATIRFDHPLDEARAINCGGTRRVLELGLHCARRGSLERFIYIGTSSVSGRRSGTIYEHELEMGQEFFNTYEHSKCESERLVREAADRLPTVVFRPSIVIGDSRTGRTSSFNVIYIPLKLLERGLMRLVPGTPDTTLDLVPVDWVNDAMVYIMGKSDAVGRVFHLTAGPARSARLGELVRSAAEYFDRAVPLSRPRAVEFLSAESYTRRLAELPTRHQALLAQVNALFPYITVDRLFDSTNADGMLEGSGIRFPLFSEYAPNIYAYCVNTRWGKAGRV